jgi:hypothetical protein
VSHAEVERNYREAEENGSLSLARRVWGTQDLALRDTKKAYGDTEKKTVRMPIDRAMQVIVENKGAMPAAN